MNINLPTLGKDWEYTGEYRPLASLEEWYLSHEIPENWLSCREIQTFVDCFIVKATPELLAQTLTRRIIVRKVWTPASWLPKQGYLYRNTNDVTYLSYERPARRLNGSWQFHGSVIPLLTLCSLYGSCEQFPEGRAYSLADGAFLP